MANDAFAGFDDAMRALGLGPAGEAWRGGWERSQATYPAGGPEFLREPFVRTVCEQLGIAGDVCEAIVASLAVFGERPALRRLAWHCHATLFSDAEPNVEWLREVVSSWPMHPSQLPAWGEMFYAAVMLSGGPWMMRFHERHGVPTEVTRDTAGDLELWMRHYRSEHGRWGLDRAGWLANHFVGLIYKLGRLQFRFEFFGSDFRAYRSIETNRVLLLAPGGRRFRADGQFDGASGVFDAQGAWTSTFAEEGGVIRGNAVWPDGRAVRDVVELAAERWRCILARGEPVLGMHIPATGAMDHAACGQSLRRAMAFFPRHFPRRAFRAFHCASWFLDNQLGRLLPPASNIRRFQEEVYLYPLPDASDEQTFERVWGRPYEEAAELPRDTALRRILADHLAAGGRLHAGGCVLFPEDLDWGRKAYRRDAGRQWPVARSP